MSHQTSTAGSGNVPADPPAREATSEMPTGAVCPLKHCTGDLGIEVSAWDPIDGSPGAHLPDATHPWHGYWRLVCDQGHVVDEGAHESDGRSAKVGYRHGQILGGLR